MAEVYAGFLGHTDNEIGRLLDYLEQSGQLDNTMIVLVSDNGASGEGGPNGSVNENKFFNGLPDTIEENLPFLDVLGSPAHLQPLPDRLGVGVQHAVQDVEAVLQLRRRHGRPDDRVVAEPDHGDAASARQYTHAVDIVPTMYDCLDIELPEVAEGLHAVPARGRELRGVVRRPGRRDRQDRRSSIRWAAPRAIWHDGWKAASLSPAAPDAWAEYATQEWELFDTDLDPSECHDLADAAAGEAAGADRTCGGRRPASTTRCRSRTAAWSRSSATERPQIAKPRNRYVFYPGRAEVPESVAPNLRNRSYTIAVEADIDTDRSERRAVLARRAVRRPRALHQGRQAQVRLQLRRPAGADRRVRPSRSPTGHAVFSASFEREGDAMPAEGTLTLHIGRDKVGEGRIKTQPGKFSIAGEGLNIGKDTAEPVTDDYAGDSPWPFVGGTIIQCQCRRERRTVRRPCGRSGGRVRGGHQADA